VRADNRHNKKKKTMTARTVGVGEEDGGVRQAMPLLFSSRDDDGKSPRLRSSFMTDSAEDEEEEPYYSKEATSSGAPRPPSRYITFRHLLSNCIPTMELFWSALNFAVGWYGPRVLMKRTDISADEPPYQKTARGDLILDFSLSHPLVDPATVDGALRLNVYVRVYAVFVYITVVH
jgi:hypothetical protein